ncbi:MAG: hypothetical protein DLM64_10570 [Solirubrobacterales bacterium]|nr:MAG: hypothetical protein DLM64_10570 [Solirubrobacterales bacterium]
MNEPVPPAPVIDTRRYRWAIGIFGLALVIAISIYQLAASGTGTAGIPAGRRLHLFVAPLATSTLNGDANLSPRCDASRPNPRALNVCARAPLVLGFFVPGAAQCMRQIDTLQALAREFSPAVQFAAVAVRSGRAETAAVAHAHRWTIPVAYDRDGAVGEVYGVQVCPLVEVVHRGGIVADRLVGGHWLARAALAERVRALVGG